MIDKLRRILRLDSVEDKLLKLNNINNELDLLKSNVDDLALEYTKRSESRKKLKESVSDDIIKSVDERFEIFQSGHLKDTVSIKKEIDKLEIEKSELESDKLIIKALQDLKDYNNIKIAYKSNTISVEVFDTFLKAKQGKVKYADFLVFNEKGELLIIQRSKTDKSNPEKWVIPGGHVDVGEDFKTAALRELNEEAGININECEKVGEYSDKNAQIEYYKGNIKSDEQEVILETKESQDSVWINPHTDLDKYEMVFNMKDNIKNILGITDNVATIKGDKDKYAEKIEKLKERRDPDNIEKSDDKEEINHLKEMIAEHERLIDIMKPHAKNDPKVATELGIQAKELKEYKKKLAHEQKEVDLPEKIEKAIESGALTGEAIELIKARTGVYSDNAQNRQLKRVGQKYGSSKQGQETPSKDGKQEEKPESKQQTPESLSEDAKNTSEPLLQEAIKNSKSPEVRQVAHNELKRRQDEEHPQEEKFGEPKKEDEQPKKEEKPPESTETKKEESKPDKETSKETKDGDGSKNDLDTKEGIEAEIKRLKNLDIDYSDNKALDENLKQIRDLYEKRKTVLDKQSSERKVSFEEYSKDFKSLKFKDPTNAHEKDLATPYYKKDQDKLKFKNGEEDSLNEYLGENYEYMRMQLTDPEKYKNEYGDDPNMEKDIKNISNFISNNKISENLSLNRRVKGDGKKFFKGLSDGDIYEDKSFSSTPLQEESLFGDYNIEILAKKGSSVANANNPDEAEYLIDKGSKFRVLKTSDTGMIVELL